MVDDEKSAANKTRVLRVEYRREDQYLSIEIQPYRISPIGAMSKKGLDLVQEMQRGKLHVSHVRLLFSADGSTHTESNKLYCKVKHRYRPNLSPRQRPTAKARHAQAALAASAEARGATHRARPGSPSSPHVRVITLNPIHRRFLYRKAHEHKRTWI